MAVGQR